MTPVARKTYIVKELYTYTYIYICIHTYIYIYIYIETIIRNPKKVGLFGYRHVLPSALNPDHPNPPPRATHKDERALGSLEDKV